MGRNRVRIPLFGMALMASLGCDESTTLVLEPNPAVRVVMDGSACPRVEACGQCLLKAAAFDKNSKPAQFPTLIWTSSDLARATVDANGRVSGWRGGAVTIRVEVLETAAFDEIGIPVVVNPQIPCNPPAARIASR